MTQGLSNRTIAFDMNQMFYAAKKITNNVSSNISSYHRNYGIRRITFFRSNITKVLAVLRSAVVFTQKNYLQATGTWLSYIYNLGKLIVNFPQIEQTHLFPYLPPIFDNVRYLATFKYTKKFHINRQSNFSSGTIFFPRLI